MNLNYLRYFQVLAEMRHYTRAAKSLHITQPALSNAIHSLETELGVPLFVRDGRFLSLSPYGQLLLPHVTRIFAELEQGVSSIEKCRLQESRTVRVSYIDLLETCLIPELTQSLTREEGIHSLKLELCHATTGAAKERLRQGTLDFAFCLGEEEMDGLEWMPVQRIPFVLITPEGHPLGQREAVSLEEIAAYPFLSYSAESGMHLRLERGWKNQGISPTRAGEGYNEMDLIGMVLHGKGISLLPNISLLALFPVCVVPVQDLPEACTVCLAWESGGKRGEAAEHFLTFCRKHYGSATEQAFSPLIKSEER